MQISLQEQDRVEMEYEQFSAGMRDTVVKRAEVHKRVGMLLEN